MLNEKCAVFGIYAPGEDVARYSYYALAALQHRGQESSGIVVTDGTEFQSHIAPGLVAQVYDEDDLNALKGFAAIGHNRYSTSGGADHHHAQPVLRSDDVLALAHNGNLPSTRALEQFLKKHQIYKAGSNDSEMMTDAIRYWRYQGLSLVEAIKRTWSLFTGAFSCVVLGQEKLLAFRDACGIRPLAIGRLKKGGYVIASESCAFDIIGAEYERDVRPGELIEIHDGKLRSYQIAKGAERLEVFEYIYFARPDSWLQGQRVNEVRRRLGQQLALEVPAEADVVIPVPDSSIPAALGYAAEAGLAFDHGLIKNRYIHRTFISPGQALRQRQVQMKLNPLKEVVRGKRIILIDDSIVRGTTTRQIITMLRRAGARTIHVRVSSPPVLYPDFYGIDTPDQTQLIAARLKDTKAIAQEIGADSLGYLSLEGMVKAIDRTAQSLCLACFNGEYPVDLYEKTRLVRKIRFRDGFSSGKDIG
ncbi:amidophosphoribosyltransferase [Candidatus Saccharibacteria bacterium]|nr:amidophosphoribosyltransferase [Candidatus Saccharibacteria bacterium]